MLLPSPSGLKAARLQVAGGGRRFPNRFAAFSIFLRALVLMLSLLSPACLRAFETEILFADYDDQGFFNNFSGDSGVFANSAATVTMSFATNGCFGGHGASLRV